MSKLGVQLKQNKCICSTSDNIGCLVSSNWFDLCDQYTWGALFIFQSESAKVMCHAGMFMLRHSIELLIKGILINKCNVPATDALDKNHDFDKLVSMINCKSDLFVYVPQDVIKNFDKLDKKNIEFRYPVDKQNNATCQNNGCIDIDLLKKQSLNILVYLEMLQQGTAQ